MSQAIQAIVFHAPGEITLRKFELGPCDPTNIVVRTLYTMVSTGTELRVLAGLYGAAKNFPLIPGYAVIGEVIAAGAEVKGYRVGDLVTGRNPRPVPGIKSQWGGQASQHVYVTKGEDRSVVLPHGAKPLDFVIAEVSAISLRGVTAAKPKPGETAVVLGQGVIGAFSAAWLHARGCRVIVADLEAGRLQRALAWGAAAAVNITAGNAAERILTLCDGGADIVVETSGTSAGAKLACQLVRPQPPIVSAEYRVEPMSSYGNWARLVFQAGYLEEIPINPASFFAGEGLTILTPSDRGIEDRQAVVEALRRGVIRAADFVQRVTPFTDAPQAYLALRDDKNCNFSLVFDWTKA